MIKSHEGLSKQALRLVMAGIAVSCLGAAVVAAPLSMTPKSKIFATDEQAAHERTSYAPLARGVAIELGRADKGEDEDCVRINKMTTPDGQVYVTRGLICGGE